jgi:hypothetical protein
MNPLKAAKFFTQSKVELIELAPGLKVTQDFIDSYPERELPHFIQGYIDILEGRVVSHEEVLKILAEDAKQRGLDSESTSRL